MRILEYRQSDTSPLRYHIELNPDEMKLLKDKYQWRIIIQQILECTNHIEKRKGHEKNGE
tara:strand:- start:1790 stop:1969 length:180 start_codon:yes stop_codon:yes gene_type:complete